MKNSGSDLDDSRDDSNASSASGMALAEEGERRTIALAGAVAAAVKAGDVELARRFAEELAALLGSVSKAIANG